MAITANMTTHQGRELTDAYCVIKNVRVKKFDDFENIVVKDEEGAITSETNEKKEGFWKLFYEIEIYEDKDKRDHHDSNMYKIKNNHIDMQKIDFDINSSSNLYSLAYNDLKTNENLSNAKDA